MQWSFVAKLLSFATSRYAEAAPGIFMLQKSVAKVKSFATIFAKRKRRHAHRVRPGFD